MVRSLLPLSLARIGGAWALVSGCADDPSPPCTSCALTDAHNYRYSSELGAEVVPLRAGADATVTWAALTTDIRGRPLDPDAIDAMLVLFGSLTPAEVLVAAAEDALDGEIAGYFFCDPDGATCALSEFCLAYACLEPAEHFEAARGTWAVMLRGVDEQGGDQQGALSLMFLSPEADAVGTEAAFTDASASLTMDVRLSAPLRVGAAVEVDWSGVTRDGLGNGLDAHRIDRLELARHDLPVAELEAGFARVDELAGARWSMDVEGADHASLSGLTGDTAFAGIDADHTWLLALRCTTCLNPYPPIVVVLEGG